MPEPTDAEVVVNREQAEAMCKWLIDSGDMTPMARMQLRKLWSGDRSHSDSPEEGV